MFILCGFALGLENPVASVFLESEINVPLNRTVRPRFNLVFELWFPGFAQRFDLREINELVQHKIRNVDIRAMAKNESIRYLY